MNTEPSAQTDIQPITEEVLRECPRLRILVLGRSGAGKSALINRVFGVDVTTVQSDSPGQHDIHHELTSPNNPRLILHDSQGFEAGSRSNLDTVLNFIEERSKQPGLRDQLHAIWLCVEIPFAGARTFEAGDEQILRRVGGEVPVFVVFTKLDILKTRHEERLDEELDDSMDEDGFEAAVQRCVDDDLRKLCTEPLEVFEPHRGAPADERKFQSAAVSVKRNFDKSVQGLVDRVLKDLPEKVWLPWAIAQRVSATVSIDASIIVGRKKYWRGLMSDIFIGVTMEKCLTILRNDIVAAWNMQDGYNHLLSEEFLLRLTVLVSDLRGNGDREPFQHAKKAIKAVAENPAAVIFAGPIAAGVIVVEWIYETVRRTKDSLRCLMGFIVDLTLTMDALFWLTKQDPSTNITIRSINIALKIHKGRKERVHGDIRRWVDGLDSLDRLRPERTIGKLEELISHHRFDPERATRSPESTGASDEGWIALEELEI